MTRTLLTASIQRALLATFVLATGGYAGTALSADAAAALDAEPVTGAHLAPAHDGIGLPVHVIDRAQIDASGDISVAELLRDSTFAAFGNRKPQSGNGAQALSTIDLRGLGSGRTLVLIDGRRAPTNPMSASSGADLGAIPLAAVERIEILAHGASAIYGADAVGGVVNIILRRDFSGAELSYGNGRSAVEGGDLEAMSAVFGTGSDRTRIFGGASAEKRGMVFTRDQIGGDAVGITLSGNNYYDWATGSYAAVPGFDCSQGAFYLLANGLCSFDFNQVAANEADHDKTSVFVNGDHRINDDWSVYFGASSTLVESFGRYAPVPGLVGVADGTPNDINDGVACGVGGCEEGTTDGLPTYFYHRFAAAGNRDTFVDAENNEYLVGFQGRLTDRIGVDVALRRTDYTMTELGRGFLVGSLAAQAANDGSYLFSDPFGASEATIDGFTATTSRVANWQSDELHANLDLDLFALAGGRSRAVVGVELRDERLSDEYDSLSNAGVVLGSSGGSGGGPRDVRSAYFEWNLPFHDTVDVTVAGRQDDYSDIGSEFSPSVSVRWQPLDSLGFRSSWGEGARAPGIDLMTTAASFSSEPVNDPASCDVFDEPPYCIVQVPTTTMGNAELHAERSEHASLGVVYAPAPWLSASLDAYGVRIEDTITRIYAQDVINWSLATDIFGPVPDGLGVQRAANGMITGVVVGFANAGATETWGLDLDVHTHFEFGAAGTLDSRLAVTRVLGYRVENVFGGEYDFAGLHGVPEVRAALANAWTLGDFAVAWNVNYIKGQGTGSPRLGGYATNDVQLSWRAPWNATIAVGATNVGDRYPELVQFDGRPWNFYLYDAYGRTPYLRYTQAF